MPSTTDFLLSIEDLSVSFDGFRAVDGLTLYIDSEELRFIIGPNGAGKTTVLDLICGKTRPTSGSIQYRNRELVGMPEYKIVRLGIGRKFQTPSIYDELTVLENLEVSYPTGRSVMGCLIFRRSPHVRERIEETAEEIFLQEHLHRKAGLLSHGQKQWLEIGMLLMQEPELMMLDEPVAGMSQSEREATAELLPRLTKGRSIIIIEHDMDFVRTIARKVTVLHLGRMIAEGTMDEIQNNQTVQDVYLGH
jgi:urea transport system ATP-binding protein